MFTPKSVLHWGLPAHPAKFSPSEALSACSTWPNYIQSEGKDSPLWSTRDRQPSSGWLDWHLMLLSARHFSRTDVFECCLKSQTADCVCDHTACVDAHAHVLGTSGEWCVTCEVSCGPFFLIKIVLGEMATGRLGLERRSKSRMFIVKWRAGSNYFNHPLNYWLAGLSFFVGLASDTQLTKRRLFMLDRRISPPCWGRCQNLWVHRGWICCWCCYLPVKLIKDAMIVN